MLAGFLLGGTVITAAAKPTEVASAASLELRNSQLHRS
jgi:hypothetical protein